MSEFVCEGTAEMVCPYCGAEQSDPWEYNLSDGDETSVDCDGCGKEYRVSAQIEITYTSRCINCEFEASDQTITNSDGREFRTSKCKICGDYNCEEIKPQITHIEK